MKVYFDMDGTIADLYGVDDWLSYLQEENPYPYMVAKTHCNMSLLARRIHELQKIGVKVGVISWLSKTSNARYDTLVTEAKKDWLKKHLPSVTWDEIHIIAYGYAKVNYKNSGDILFDDEERNRNTWGDGSYNEKEIFKILKEILDANK